MSPVVAGEQVRICGHSEALRQAEQDAHCEEAAAILDECRGEGDDSKSKGRSGDDPEAAH